MALNDEQLKTDLKALYDATKASTDAATAEQDFINALALAIKNYVLSASIIYTGGLDADGTAVAGTFEGNLQ